jgi:hypothetical protein
MVFGRAPLDALGEQTHHARSATTEAAENRTFKIDAMGKSAVLKSRP